jgi:hypothetical protein
MPLFEVVANQIQPPVDQGVRGIRESESAKVDLSVAVYLDGGELALAEQPDDLRPLRHVTTIGTAPAL